MPDVIDETVIRQTAERLRAYLSETGRSQKSIGKALGVSGAQISTYLQGRHTGDTQGLTRKIVELLETQARRARARKGPDYVETAVAKRIFTAIRTAEKYSDDVEGKISVIVGDAGHGKSLCLRQYAAANPNTVYVMLDETMNSVGVFAELCTAMKLDSHGILKTLAARLTESLAGRSLTVIIDEASHLSVRVLNQLRQVITVRCRCPLILSGNQHLKTTLDQDAVRRGYESLDQVRSRVVEIVDLDVLANMGDDGGLYTADDIRKLYEYGGIRLVGGAVERLQDIARTPKTGRLRTCSTIIWACHGAPLIQDSGKIDGNNIIQVILLLGLPIIDRLPFADRVEKARRERRAEEAEIKAAMKAG